MTKCKDFYGLDENYFQEKSCIHTASEIAGQPKLWNELANILQEKKQDISDFFEQLGDLNKLRIILTGAGSSAFIGEVLAFLIAKSSGIECTAISTTDIVSSPDTVLIPDIPTLLVSFARSGNSPESVGAVEYARKNVKNLFEAAIVCDGTSKLYTISAQNKKNLILVMPEGANDKGFAMTASVSCMILAGFALFNHNKIEEIVKDIRVLSEKITKIGFRLSEFAKKCAKIPFERAVYLGSGAFKGLAHEGSLKMMELTNGAVNASYDSAAGFRHGPKTVIKDNTLTLHFISDNPFTAKYDIDLLKEVFGEKNKNICAAICPDKAEGIQADEVLVIDSYGNSITGHLCTGINGLVFFQMLSMFKSIELGITTDNPSPGGQVNRVVKGVTVYSYE